MRNTYLVAHVDEKCATHFAQALKSGLAPHEALTTLKVTQAARAVHLCKPLVDFAGTKIRHHGVLDAVDRFGFLAEPHAKS